MTLRTVIVALILSASVYAQDPKQLAQEGKDAAEVQRNYLKELVYAAKNKKIFDRFSQMHSCPNGAALNLFGQIACSPVQQPQAPPVQAPAPTH